LLEKTFIESAFAGTGGADDVLMQEARSVVDVEIRRRRG
jgi:hypothetical protein